MAKHLQPENASSKLASAAGADDGGVEAGCGSGSRNFLLRSRLNHYLLRWSFQKRTHRLSRCRFRALSFSCPAGESAKGKRIVSSSWTRASSREIHWKKKVIISGKKKLKKLIKTPRKISLNCLPSSLLFLFCD